MHAPAIFPVLLSGGSGTRLWPLSRPERPKQFHALVGPETLIQATALRARAPGWMPPVVVAGQMHGALVEAQLAEAGVSPEAIVLEPAGRNTAAAIALAALLLDGRRQGAALMLVMPCDHVIADAAAFHAAVAVAATPASAGRLLTFGVVPEGPATGYGYIHAGAAVDGVAAVRQFVEKPDAVTAARYVAEGYFWNAGIFLFRADAILAALEAHAPAVLAAARAAMAGAQARGAIILPNTEAFLAAPSISIDYAVMQAATDIDVVPVSMGWSDVGSWAAMWEAGARDGSGNAVIGDAAVVDCANCLVTVGDGPRVAALGLSDVVIVSSGDAVLVMSREAAERARMFADDAVFGRRS